MCETNCPWRQHYVRLTEDKAIAQAAASSRVHMLPSLKRHKVARHAAAGANGFERIARCREALAALDRSGWQRSFHQRQFHEAYIRACARIFFKTDPPGTFMREQKKLLEMNNWDSIQQEVLISTPRRFGKTVSISMFAAALIYSCPTVECSIYSTCKRISTKLLRNVVKYLDHIHEQLNVPKFRELRSNQEELVLQGPDGRYDVRLLNSYPSKVTRPANARVHAHANACTNAHAKHNACTAPVH
jgi:hypothetical protein